MPYTLMNISYIVEKCFATYATRIFIYVFTRSYRWSLSWARGSQSILSHVISLIIIKTYSSHLSLCLRNYLVCKYQILFYFFTRNYPASPRLLGILMTLCFDINIIEFTVTLFHARRYCFLGIKLICRSKINLLKLTVNLEAREVLTLKILINNTFAKWTEQVSSSVIKRIGNIS